MIKKGFFKSCLIVFAFSMPALVQPSTKTKVDQWFTDMNYANVTVPGVYEGQASRYMTLGGISTRTPTRDFQLISVQTPSFSAGCGGIDFYAGGFEAVNADEIVAQLRAIGQNAQSLAFMLAIQVVSPQLSGVMEEIQAWADKFKEFMSDSCAAASTLVGGALEHLDKEKANCISTRQEAYGEDFSEASHNCTTGGNRQATKDSDGEKNKIDFVEGNLAWYVMMQDPYFRNDLEFAELIMNITGTVILTTKGGENAPITPVVISPSIKDDALKAEFENIFNAMLYGKNGTADLKIRKCKSRTNQRTGCQEVDDAPKKINVDWIGVYDKVNTLIDGIAKKVKSDQALTNSEKGLISSTSIPLYRYITAASTSLPDSQAVSQLTRRFSRAIAQDIVIRGLTDTINSVHRRSTMLEKGMGDSSRVVKFREDLDDAMLGLQRKRIRNEEDVEQILAMQEQIKTFERALLARIGKNLSSSAMWGG